MNTNTVVVPQGRDTVQNGGAQPDLSSIFIVLAVIVIAGLLGGSAAHSTAPAEAKQGARQRTSWGRFVLLGTVAAACVPLFLSLVQSNLVEDFFERGAGFPFESYLVFLGLCLIAAFSARTFLESVSRRVLRDLENVKEQQENIALKVEETAELVDEQRAEPVDAQKQLEALSLSDTSVIPETNELERRGLRAMTKMTFRTATGIASDIGISRNQIGEVLDSLEGKGLITLTQSPTTKGPRWKITPKGIAALSRATDN